MFEQQMSQSIEAGAPDITYSGNEGPKSPQQEQQMMEQQMMMQEQQMMAPVDYSSREYKIKLIEELRSGGLDYGAAVREAERLIKLMLDRQGAAFGGIMGLDGRRKYGIGSKLKSFVRKVIPNEISEIAVKAAPFVAPFNPLAAGLMSGIGGFDQTGRIGSSLKSGLMNYGMGQLARGIGGGMDNLQASPFRKGATMGQRFSGFGDASTMGKGFGKYFSSPIQNSGGLGEILADKGNQTGNITETISDGMGGEFEVSGNALKGTGGKNINSLDRLLDRGEIINRNPISKLGSKIMEYVPTSLGQLNPLGQKFDIKKLIGAGGILTLGTKLLGGGPEETVSAIMDRGEGLDIDGIRTEVIEAYKDSTGEKLLALRSKYPFLGTQASKNTAIMAMGGRIRRAEGGLMNLGGMEKDYRAEGGFVPIGAKEKADDVPARLSVNEFVFTADAVRGAGQGDIDKGAEIMERVMKNLEQGGQISEDSQGLQGAREMFQTSQRLGEVL
jgi:hypothetical protein